MEVEEVTAAAATEEEAMAIHPDLEASLPGGR